MMTILFGWLGLAGLGAILAVKAPVGYEDEHGFHYGSGPSRQPVEPAHELPEPVFHVS